MMRRIAAGVCGVVLVLLATSGAQASQLAAAPAPRVALSPSVKLSATTGPPGSSVTVSGTGFGPNETVDLYFDTTDEALAATSSTGAFSGITIGIPASAAPGQHWITADGRHSGLSAQASFSVATSWPQFRNGPKRRGVDTTENVLGPPNVSGIDLNWSYTTGNVIDSSPAVAGGVVYIGSDNGKVYALNAATGALDWSYTTGAAINSSPAVANGLVYIGSFDNRVYALNAATGAADWSYTTGDFVYSSPAIADGVVYVGSGDGNVYAFGLSGGTTGGVRRQAPASLRPDRHLRPPRERSAG